MPKDKKPLKSVHYLALFLTIRRAIDTLPDFAAGGDGIVQMNAPAGTDVEDYLVPLVRFLYKRDDPRGDEIGHLIVNVTDKPKFVLNSFVDKCADARRAIVIRDHGAELPSRVLLAVDKTVDLEPVSARDFRVACRRNLGMRVSEEDAARALAYPHEFLWAALRKGRPINDVLHRLSQACPDVEREERRGSPEVPPLSEMHGYGAAKQWGLELAQDLADWRTGKIDWSQVDKGIVLSGPPGVGKTIFARSVARECDIPIIAGSLGLWQSAGHLGDLLKAMRKDFSRAKETAPCVLFVDELDAFGDRNSFEHDHKDYSIQVVNGFLELLDGVDGREGVIVIGATNDITRIDPAILRSGRLDRHIDIGLPDGDDRIAILDQQLNGSIARNELAILRDATRGLTGADLAKVVRDANRVARRERRDIVMADLESALPDMVPITGKLRTAFAIHEAGHTVAILRLRHGEYQGTMIIDRARNDSAGERAGAASFNLPNIGHRDQQFYLDHIAVNLAGIAAEEVILGSISDGAGGGRNSDLAVATRIATYMQTSMGMGSRLRHSLAREDEALERLRHADPSVSRWVDEVLAAEFARAKQLIRDNRLFVERIAALLVEKGRVTPKAVAILDPDREPAAATIVAA